MFQRVESRHDTKVPALIVGQFKKSNRWQQCPSRRSVLYGIGLVRYGQMAVAEI
jgi:hypothetical protein